MITITERLFELLIKAEKTSLHYWVEDNNIDIFVEIMESSKCYEEKTISTLLNFLERQATDIKKVYEDTVYYQIRERYNVHVSFESDYDD